MRQVLPDLAPAAQMQPGQANWAQEFPQHMTPDDQARMEAAFHSGKAAAQWNTAEFESFQQHQHQHQHQHHQHAAAPPAQQQGAYFRQINGYNLNGGMPIYSGLRSQVPPPMQQHDPHGKGKQAVVELDDSKWEEQFRELDQDAALDEAANKAIEAELNGTETMQGDFQAIWDGIQKEARERADLETLDWANEIDADMTWNPENSMSKSIPNMGVYLFEPDNPYMNHQDPYSEGKRLVETGGNLSLAALAFEAAVQQNEKHVDAWTDLGACQAMNEKETPAIRAYETALRLDENKLLALMGLSVSYTNEGYDSQAYQTLERWLRAKYPSIAEKAGPAPATVHDRQALHDRVTDLFIQAAMLVPEGQAMDADVQVGLGVLFYGDEEYDKAVDCFEAALNSSSTSTSPEYLLWNRLGATLANSGRSEEAINAYERALQLNPNFVRARYNLGVSCINIGCFKEAAEHLLGALAMHKVAEEKAREDARAAGVEPERIIHNQSTNLFDTLRRVFGQMGRRDLADHVVNGMDLDMFRYVPPVK
jgi:tetratricopeptide (TPR) repeat protein